MKCEMIADVQGGAGLPTIMRECRRKAEWMVNDVPCCTPCKIDLMKDMGPSDAVYPIHDEPNPIPSA